MIKLDGLMHKGTMAPTLKGMGKGSASHKLKNMPAVHEKSMKNGMMSKGIKGSKSGY